MDKNRSKKIAKEKAKEHLKNISDTFSKLKSPNFPEIAKRQKLEIYQTPVFSRGQYLPVVGISKDFQDAAFSLTKQNPLSDIIDTGIGCCILHLDAIMPINLEKFDKNKEEFSDILLAERKNSIFTDFTARLRLKSNLEDKISELINKQEGKNRK